MKRKFVVIAVVLTLLFAGAAGVCAQTVFTVESAVEAALANNISIERGVLTLSGLERAKKHAWNTFSPSVSIGGGYQLLNDKSAQGAPYDSSLYGTVSIGVNFAPSLIAAIKTAALQYEAGELTFDETVRSIELAVRTAFYGLLYEQAYIEQQERTLETARQQYEQNLRQYNAGRISELDVLTAQVSYEQRKPTLESARTSYMNDVDTFKVLIGVDIREDISFDGSLDPLLSVGEVSLDPSSINPPSVALLEKQLEVAQATLSATRLYCYGPTLSLSWGYQPLATDADDFKEWNDMGSLSLTVSLPIDSWFPWSSSADSIASAKDSVADLQLQLEDTKQEVGNSIVSYLRQINQSRVSIETCRANVNLAQRSYDLAQEAYNRGSRDFLSLQDASDTLFDAQVLLLSEAYNLGVTILNLENTAGIPFGTIAAR